MYSGSSWEGGIKSYLGLLKMFHQVWLLQLFFNFMFLAYNQSRRRRGKFPLDPRTELNSRFCATDLSHSSMPYFGTNLGELAGEAGDALTIAGLLEESVLEVSAGEDGIGMGAEAWRSAVAWVETETSDDGEGASSAALVGEDLGRSGGAGRSSMLLYWLR